MLRFLLRVPAALLLATVLAPPAAVAAGFTGSDLLVPVVARVPGELGTLWRTDLVVTNTSREIVWVPVTVTFSRAGEPDQVLSFELGPRVSAVMPDVLWSELGLEEAFGTVRVTSSDPAARLTARARIYNAGGAAGEYGQAVPALPIAMLSLESYTSGLSGVTGNRTNVGIANPHDVEVPVFVSLFDAEGSFRGAVGLAVPANDVLQLNNVFEWLNTAPFDGATVQVNAELPVYSYASVVRDDTGDAVFVVGVGESAAVTH